MLANLSECKIPIRDILEIFESFGQKIALSDGVDKLTYKQFVEKLRERIKHYDTYPLGENENFLLITNQSIYGVVEILATVFSSKVPFIADPTWDDQTIASILSTYNIKTVISVEKNGKLKVNNNHIKKFSCSKNSSSKSILSPRSKTAFIRFSSGSTGKPKALEFSLHTMIKAAQNWMKAAQYTANDRIMCLATLNNGLAFNTSLLSCFLCGCSLHLHSGILNPSSILRNMDLVKPSVLIGFPLMWQLLLKRPKRLINSLSECRNVISSAAPLSHNLAKNWLTVTKKPIGHYYGIAETGPVTFSDGKNTGSSGQLIPGVSILLTGNKSSNDYQHLLVSTGTHASGYLSLENNKIPENEDGYYKTGDMARLDDNGYLFIGGRADRIVNYHGKKFSLNDIEETIKALNGVHHVYVFLESIPEFELTAIVESQSLEALQISRHCIKLLPTWQVPANIKVIPSFPLSATGKVMTAQFHNKRVIQIGENL